MVVVMWKKGSYDVSNGHKERFNQLNPVTSENHQGRINTRIRKLVESVCSRLQRIYKGLQRISGIPENFVLFLAVFFLIISVLIGVIIWLSVSVHLINMNNIQTTSILDELLSNNRFIEKSGWNRNEETTASTEVSTSDFQSSQKIIAKNHGPCVEMLKAFLEFVISLERPRGELEKISDEEKGSPPNVFISPGKGSPTKSTTCESFSKATREQMKDLAGFDCKIIIPKASKNKVKKSQNENAYATSVEHSIKGNVENITEFTTEDMPAEVFHIITTDSTGKIDKVPKTFKLETSDDRVDSDEDQSNEDDENSPIYLNVKDSVLAIYNVPIIISRCDPQPGKRMLDRDEAKEDLE